ncbi:hypothetical protein R3P38DRAFT_2786745 [Favolaschia claudopus]|uniref:Uncharacterized protein n=1 Tax=Favolaschia claudopus TaxID=2862362 RepID=A0AAW0ATD6_9AGAR
MEARNVRAISARCISICSSRGETLQESGVVHAETEERDSKSQRRFHSTWREAVSLVRIEFGPSVPKPDGSFLDLSLASPSTLFSRLDIQTASQQLRQLMAILGPGKAPYWRLQARPKAPRRKRRRGLSKDYGVVDKGYVNTRIGTAAPPSAAVRSPAAANGARFPLSTFASIVSFPGDLANESLQRDIIPPHNIRVPFSRRGGLIRGAEDDEPLQMRSMVQDIRMVFLVKRLKDAEAEASDGGDPLKIEIEGRIRRRMVSSGIVAALYSPALPSTMCAPDSECPSARLSTTSSHQGRSVVQRTIR